MTNYCCCCCSNDEWNWWLLSRPLLSNCWGEQSRLVCSNNDWNRKWWWKAISEHSWLQKLPSDDLNDLVEDRNCSRMADTWISDGIYSLQPNYQLNRWSSLDKRRNYSYADIWRERRTSTNENADFDVKFKDFEQLQWNWSDDCLTWRLLNTGCLAEEDDHLV